MSIDKPNSALPELSIDRREFGVEGSADTVDDSDDGYRNAGRDQAIFDRRGAGFIAEETSDNDEH
jgi:hypothetical protein